MPAWPCTTLGSNSELKITEQDREELRRYLLGQMVEVDLSQVEERLMSESDLYEEILILEDEIIDQYVRGAMSDGDRASFENYFLGSAEHQQKVRFAKALTRYVDRAGSEVGDLKPAAVASATNAAESRKPGRANVSAKSRRFSFWLFQNPALSSALASLLIIGFGASAWIVIRTSKPTDSGKVFEATLVPGGITREGGELQTISIPPGMDTLRVRLILPAEPYADYKIELLSSESSSVLTRDQLKSTEEAGNKVLYVDITANLRRDTYKLKLSARSAGAYEEIASYNFRIALPKSS